MKDGLVRARRSCPEHMREGKPEISGQGSKVPLSWHSLPHQLWEEFFHSYELDAGVLLTLLDEQPAVAAIRSQKQAVGMTLNSAHMDLMYARLASVVFQAFRDPTDDLYEPALGKLLGVKKTTKTTVTRNNPKKKPKGAKNKPKEGKKESKPKKTTKKKKTDDEEEEDGEELPEEDEAEDDDEDLEEDEGDLSDELSRADRLNPRAPPTQVGCKGPFLVSCSHIGCNSFQGPRWQPGNPSLYTRTAETTLKQ